MDDQVGSGEVMRDRQARADSVFVDYELIAVPAESGVDSPFAEMN